MAKKRRQITEEPAAAQRIFEPGVKLLAYFERHAGWIAVLAILFASARIVATCTVFSHTSDEPAHVACGLEWLDKGRYTWEPQHPPLARVAAALGPYLLGAHSQWGDRSTLNGMTYEGVRILYSGNRYDLSLALARLGVLPFFWLASLVVYEWGRRYFDRAIAAMAVCLFTFTPPVLAHAGLATTDMALTAFLGAAFLAGVLWTEEPTPARAAIFGLCGGLAALAKFSSLVFFPAAAGLTLLWYIARERPAGAVLFRTTRRRLPSLALAALVCCLVVWAGYRFSVGKVSFANLALPAPEFFAGLQQVQHHSSVGHASFLLGQRGRYGWWYFFPVALGVKSPLALLILLAVGIVLLVRKQDSLRNGWMPAAFAAGILAVGMTSSINIGVRHVLPVYLSFSLLASAGARWMLEQRRAIGIAAGVLCAWLAASSLISHPDYLPYFNELAGSHPENILVDSDLDWGQDLKRLAARLKEAGATEVTLLTPYIDDFQKDGLPHRNEKLDLFQPPVGWCAISVSYWKEFRLGLMDRYSQYTIWPDRYPPTEKIGKGIDLWYFPPRQVSP